MAASWAEMPVAGPRSRRRFDVEHRRQRVVLGRGVLLEKGHFLHRRPAPVDEMIGAVRHARRLRPGPVGLEALVGVIAALGRLDPGELDAAARDRVPVDVALELRHVDAVDRIVPRMRQIAVDKSQGVAAAPGASRKQRRKRNSGAGESPVDQKLAVRHHRPVNIAPAGVVATRRSSFAVDGQTRAIPVTLR